MATSEDVLREMDGRGSEGAGGLSVAELAGGRAGEANGAAYVGRPKRLSFLLALRTGMFIRFSEPGVASSLAEDTRRELLFPPEAAAVVVAAEVGYGS